MTVLVGIEHEDHVLIGGDSAAASEHRIIPRAGGKVHKLGARLVVGCAGSVRAQQILRYDLEVPDRIDSPNPQEWMVTRFIPNLRQAFKDGGHAKTIDGQEDGEVYLLVGIENELFAVWNDYQVERSQLGYHALGSGAYFALGSLFTSRDCSPHTRLYQAMEAAACFNTHVAPPFTVETTERG
jgi:ATP-dependent protease HslVU (ClpYQ) peptidase subunit